MNCSQICAWPYNFKNGIALQDLQPIDGQSKLEQSSSARITRTKCIPTQHE